MRIDESLCRTPPGLRAVRWHIRVVVCSETIEHLENPRHVFRTLRRLVRPGGTLLLTMPNQESIRSYAELNPRIPADAVVAHP